MRFVGVFVAIILYLLVESINETAGKIKKDANILILGAGISGVSAAKRLKELGYSNLHIIEGSDRVGGRTFSIRLGDYTVELGAIFLNGGKTNPLFPLLEKYNLSYHTPDPDDWVVRDTDGTDVTGRAEAIYNRRFEPAMEKVEAFTEMARKEGRHDYTLRAALTKAGWRPKSFLDDAIEYFETDYTYAYDPGEVSGLHDFVDEPLETVNYTQEVIKADDKGYEYIVQSMLNEVTEENTEMLKLNKVVKEIEQTGQNVTITTKTGETFSADYVIVTFSLGVLQRSRVTFKPELPDWKKDSIYQFQMAHYTNVYVQFNESFWDDNQWIVYAGERENFNMIVNLNKIFPGSNIINLEATNRESIRIERLNDSEIIEEAVTKLRKLYGAGNVTVPYPIRYGISRFSRNHLFEGAYSNWPPGYTKDDHDALKAPVDRVYFAGEHTSYFYYGYMHGSYYSGIDVSDALDKCIQQSDCQKYIPVYAARGCMYTAASNYDAKARQDDGSCKFHSVSGFDSVKLSSTVLCISLAILFKIALF